MRTKRIKRAGWWMMGFALLISRAARAQEGAALANVGHQLAQAFDDTGAGGRPSGWWTSKERKSGTSDIAEQDLIEVGPSARVGDFAPALSKLTGVGDAGIQMKRIVESLRNPARAASLGIRIPRSILLVGPAAAAKARVLDAFLKDAGLTYHRYKGDDLVSHSVGSGGAAVEKAFAIARRDTPSLLVIDPIESVAGKRETIYDVPESRQFLEEMAKPDPTPADRLPSFILVGVAQDDQAIDPTIASSFDATIKVASGDPQN